MEVWINPTGTAAPNTNVYSLDAVFSDAEAYSGIFVGNDTDTSEDRIWAQNYDGTNDQVGVTYNRNEWTHIAWVHSGGTLYIYKNGILGGSVASGNTSVLTYTVSIGYRDNYFAGKLDNIKTYNYARTAAQVAWDYNRGGPVGHWKFDECQGSTVNSSNDPLSSSNSPLPGTLTVGSGGTQTSVGNCSTSATTAWYSGRTGKYNSSLNFDGTDDYVDTTNNPFTNNQVSSGTVSTWVKTSQTPSTYASIVSDEGWIAIDLNSSGKARGSTDGVGTNYATSTTSINNGQWHHLTLTWSGSSYTNIYVDGRLEATATPANAPTPDSNNRPLRLGTHAADLTHVFYSGQIDDVQIFNYALTPLQVKSLFNENSAIRFGPSTGSP